MDYTDKTSSKQVSFFDEDIFEETKDDEHSPPVVGSEGPHPMLEDNDDLSEVPTWDLLQVYLKHLENQLQSKEQLLIQAQTLISELKESEKHSSLPFLDKADHNETGGGSFSQSFEAPLLRESLFVDKDDRTITSASSPITRGLGSSRVVGSPVLAGFRSFVQSVRQSGSLSSFSPVHIKSSTPSPIKHSKTEYGGSIISSPSPSIATDSDSPLVKVSTLRAANDTRRPRHLTSSSASLLHQQQELRNDEMLTEGHYLLRSPILFSSSPKKGVVQILHEHTVPIEDVKNDCPSSASTNRPLIPTSFTSNMKADTVQRTATRPTQHKKQMTPFVSAMAERYPRPILFKDYHHRTPATTTATAAEATALNDSAMECDADNMGENLMSSAWNNVDVSMMDLSMAVIENYEEENDESEDDNTTAVVGEDVGARSDLFCIEAGVKEAIAGQEQEQPNEQMQDVCTMIDSPVDVICSSENALDAVQIAPISVGNDIKTALSQSSDDANNPVDSSAAGGTTVKDSSLSSSVVTNSAERESFYTEITDFYPRVKSFTYPVHTSTDIDATARGHVNCGVSNSAADNGISSPTEVGRISVNPGGLVDANKHEEGLRSWVQFLYSRENDGTMAILPTTDIVTETDTTNHKSNDYANTSNTFTKNTNDSAAIYSELLLAEEITQREKDQLASYDVIDDEESYSSSAADKESFSSPADESKDATSSLYGVHTEAYSDASSFLHESYEDDEMNQPVESAASHAVHRDRCETDTKTREDGISARIIIDGEVCDSVGAGDQNGGLFDHGGEGSVSERSAIPLRWGNHQLSLSAICAIALGCRSRLRVFLTRGWTPTFMLLAGSGSGSLGAAALDASLPKLSADAYLIENAENTSKVITAISLAVHMFNLGFEIDAKLSSISASTTTTSSTSLLNESMASVKSLPTIDSKSSRSSAERDMMDELRTMKHRLTNLLMSKGDEDECGTGDDPSIFTELLVPLYKKGSNSTVSISGMDLLQRCALILQEAHVTLEWIREMVVAQIVSASFMSYFDDIKRIFDKFEKEDNGVIRRLADLSRYFSITPPSILGHTRGDIDKHRGEMVLDDHILDSLETIYMDLFKTFQPFAALFTPPTKPILNASIFISVQQQHAVNTASSLSPDRIESYENNNGNTRSVSRSLNKESLPILRKVFRAVNVDSGHSLGSLVVASQSHNILSAFACDHNNISNNTGSTYDIKPTPSSMVGRNDISRTGKSADVWLGVPGITSTINIDIDSDNNNRNKNQTYSGSITPSNTNTNTNVDMRNCVHMRLCGFSALQLTASNCFTQEEVSSAGYEAAELRGAGVPCDVLRSVGFSVRDCKNAGASIAEIISSGFSAQDVLLSNCYCVSVLRANKDIDMERAALIIFFKSLDGVHWRRSANWCSTSVALSEWHGVVLDGSGKVSRISLRGNYLKGYIHDSVSYLTGLRHIDLYDNEIYGPLPLSLCRLSNLCDVSLELNKVQLRISSEMRILMEKKKPRLIIRL